MKPASLLCHCQTLLLILLVAGHQVDAASAASSWLGKYDVVWDSPSRNYLGSMPLGNGDIALNAWVEKTGDLLFLIAKTDAWDDNARLVKVGEVRIHLEPNPFAEGQPFRQRLNLSTATIEVQAGRGPLQTSLHLWVDANNPAAYVTIASGQPLVATASVELWRTKRFEYKEVQVSDIMARAPASMRRPTIVEPDTVLTDQRGRIGWYHHNVKSFGPKLLARLQGLEGFEQRDPLLHRTFGAIVTATGGKRLDDLHLRSPASREHRFSIFVLTRHPASPKEWLAEMDKLIARVEAQDFAARRQAHERWWAEFWGRSWIRAATPGAGRDDASYVSWMYHLQRFINACAGRGRYPIKFNGSLLTVPRADGKGDPDFRRWGPGYWWQNTRLPYYTMPAAGDFDLMHPLFRMYAEELLPLCRYRTRRYCGHAGAFYPECIYFWGPIFTETYGWTPFEKRRDKLQASRWHKWEWVGGLELCWLSLEYYDHTLDRAFLAKTALPLVREILTFFDQHYPTGPDGKLVMHPAQACETWWECTNPMPEIAGCRAVAERVLALPAELVPGPERNLCQELLAKLPPLPLREAGGKKALAPAEKFAAKHNIENPELYAVFPFRLIAVGRPNIQWGLTALEHRWNRGHSGWRQDDIFMAYLGLADQARRGVVARARRHDPHQRFPAFWGPNYDWTPDQDHGSVLLTAFQSMLIQHDGRRIFLFPAWPKDWDVDFKVHAPYQTVIAGSLRGGKLRELAVTPESRKRDLVIMKPQ